MKLLSILAVLMTAMFLRAAPEPPPMAAKGTPDVTGYWEFEGDQDGTVYKGLLVIMRHGSGVAIRWVSDGGAVSVGAGMWMPDGSLIAAGGGGGVTRYVLTPDGKTMNGKWIGTSGVINSETLKFLKRRD